MKKKGFTLIELLAVIVILAIIALIATPIVMNLIENSKKGAAERSVENYVRAVETALAEERLDGPISEGNYSITADGNLVYNGVTISVDVNGKVPESGSVSITKDGVVTINSLVVNGYNCEKENDGYIYNKVNKGTSEISDSLLTINDSKSTLLANYKIYGNENDVGNYNSGTGKYEIPIKVIGKNLFDIKKYIDRSGQKIIVENIENGFKYTSNSDSGWGSYISYKIDFKEILGKTITFSSDIIKSEENIPAMRIGYWKDSSSFVGGEITTISTSGRNSVTCEIKSELPSGYSYPYIFFNVHSKNNMSGEIIEVKNIQIEIGSNPTEYEPYKEVNFAIELDKPLSCVYGVCDYIDFKSGKVVRSDGSSEDIELPVININKGVSNIFVETDVKPSKVEVEYYK